MSASSGEPIKLDSKISAEVDRLTGSTREQLIDYLAESAVRLKTLEEDLQHAHLENRYLRELLRLARIEKYGPGSEKLSEEQLALLELEPGVSQAEVEAESERANLGYRFVEPVRRLSTLGDRNYPHICHGWKR